MNITCDLSPPITVLVEEQVAEDLAKAAKKRAAGWGMEDFGARLVEVYETVR